MMNFSDAQAPRSISLHLSEQKGLNEAFCSGLNNFEHEGQFFIF